MAAATARTASPPNRETFDPLLEKVAETATFDCDWPTLRHHFYLALLAALPLFLELGPPVRHQPIRLTAGPPVAAAAPGSPSSRPTPTGESLLLSPGRAREGWDGEHHADEHDDMSYVPSTPGGLVIPPFPPLSPNRRRRSSGASDGARPNGASGPARSGNPYDEEWDDEVIIGGRKLRDWMDEDVGRREVDKVAKRLEELSFAPFTVQRLAELLIAPTRLHTSLGKFLRAVDKMLNVTTPYAPPSYTYVAPVGLPLDDVPMDSGSPIEASMPVPMPGDRQDSTVPPGASTPMFSPIPFLPGPDVDAIGEHVLESGHSNMDDALMSPLMLSDSSGVFAAQQDRADGERTPEPEEDVVGPPAPSSSESGPSGNGNGNGDASSSGDSRDEPRSGTADTPADTATVTTSVAAATEAAAVANDTESDSERANQPYLGRVDELDSGPITTNGHGGEDETGGVGEAGQMTPHGMSDRPVALSSTTVITSPEREIAPLPRRGSDASMTSAAGVTAGSGGAGAADDPMGAEGDAEAAATGTTEGDGASGDAGEGSTEGSAEGGEGSAARAGTGATAGESTES